MRVLISLDLVVSFLLILKKVDLERSGYMNIYLSILSYILIVGMILVGLLAIKFMKNVRSY